MFDFSPKSKELQRRLESFMQEHIYPNEAPHHAEIERDRWTPTRIIEELKPKARAAGLWNLFLPDSEHGGGLTNLDCQPPTWSMKRLNRKEKLSASSSGLKKNSSVDGLDLSVG
jgi:acyl-CoA dehydrogenase